MTAALGELAICILGIYGCFLTWGITQERVTSTVYPEYGDDGVTVIGKKKFKYFIVLNLLQAMGAFIVGYIYLKLRKMSLPSIHTHVLKELAQVSFLVTIASPFGYAALNHIDYPTLILGKSCKLVPVMLMSFILYRKTFPGYKYLVVFLVTAGVSGFLLLHPEEEGKKKNATNSLFGILLLTTNLMIDGTINSFQDQIFHKHKISGQALMVFMNLFSSLFMLIYLVVGPYLPGVIQSFELYKALDFCATHPRVVYDMIVFALMGALGQCFIFHTLERFGSLLLVTVTVTRKMFSILLSAFWFDHHFTFGQWLAVGLVFMGIALEAFMKMAKSKPKVPMPLDTMKVNKGRKSKKAE